MHPRFKTAVLGAALTATMAVGALPGPAHELFGSRARSPVHELNPAHEFFYIVASCGLLPRTTRPGPRLRTAFWSVASPHPREEGVVRALAVAPLFARRGAELVQDWRVSRRGRRARAG